MPAEPEFDDLTDDSFDDDLTKRYGTNGASKAAGKTAAAPRVRATNLQKSLEGLYMQIGLLVFAFDRSCGQAVMDSAEGCAKALDEAAKNNPKLKKALVALVTQSTLGIVVAAHVPIAMAIASHHVPAIRERMMMAEAAAAANGAGGVWN